MKVCLITSNIQKFCPFMYNYIDILKDKGIDFDIVEWDRKSTKVICNNNIITFGCKITSNKFVKLYGYMKWKSFIQRHLKKIKYDKIIIFTSIAGVLINKYLIKNYKDNYIYDIRDYSYEAITAYKKIVDKVIHNSYLTSISSKGFMKFLSPSEKIMINHNMSEWFSQYHTEDISLEFGKPIKIGYLGMISYFDINKRICEQIKNDTMFSAEYYGTLSKNNIINYCQENNIENVHYYGVYNNKDKFEIYKNIDFINAVYGNDRMLVTSALPNKLYDCIVCKKPIIVSNNTYLSELVEEYDLGISLDNTDNIKDAIVDYLEHFDINKFNKGCNDLFSLVVEENQRISKAIYGFLAI